MTQETKTTSTSSVQACQNCKASFGIDAQDFAFYDKIRVPLPTWCPECRLIRRLAWRNERGLHRRNCDKCGKQVISVFPPEAQHTVYCRPCWWSDAWDGLESGLTFNPNRSFLAQFHELLKKTPLMGLFGLEHTLENSPYVNMATGLKNCYLLTHSDYSENCSYGSVIDGCKDSSDNLMLAESELCFETINCRKCYKALYSVDCESCHNILFCRNCVGCMDCIGCVNLRNKKYYIFNKPYTKEAYEKLAAGYTLDTRSHIERIKADVYDFWTKFPQKYIHERHNVSVSGDYIYNSKNVRDSFIAADMEDSRFCSFVTPGKTTNCYDFTHYGISAELMYESLQAGNQTYRILCSWFAVAGERDVEYSAFTSGCQNIFGCISLKKRQYCILNKQYPKEEYEKLRAEIIDQMKTEPYRDLRGHTYVYGDFFPMEMSPFGYNLTTAQEFFPLSEQEAKEKGYVWRTPEQKSPLITLRASDIPDSTDAISDSFLAAVFGCAHEKACNEECTGAFRIIPQELVFYRKMRLPLPALCPNCRHYNRAKFRNPMKLWRRTCQCSGKISGDLGYENMGSHVHGAQPCLKEFETSYAPERSEIVYCENCYNTEVV